MAEDKARTAEEATPTPDPKAAGGGSKRPVIKKRVGSKKRREEIAQPDEFMEVGGTVVDWVLANRKIVGGVFGVLLAGLLVYGLTEKMDHSSRTDAAADLFEAQRKLPDTSVASGPGGLSISLPDPAERAAKVDEAVAALDAVIADHDGTPQASVARLDAGSALYRSGRREAALPYFEAASKESGTVGLLATGSKAAVLESLGRLDDAVVAYESVRARSTGGAKEQAFIDLARVYVANGDSAKAKELYTQFETEFPDSSLLSEVQAKAAALASL